jgi:hypothetical protein
MTWKTGGDATFSRLDGERFEIVSSVAFPPGSRPEATLAGTGENVWLKVHASRRLPDGSFHVEGRLINATRDLRAALEKAMSPDSA